VSLLFVVTINISVQRNGYFQLW